MKHFNFGFGFKEPVPLEYGKFYAEYRSQTKNKDDLKEKKEAPEPFKLEPCKQKKNLQELNIQNFDDGLMCSDGFRQKILKGERFSEEFKYIKFGLKRCDQLPKEEQPKKCATAKAQSAWWKNKKINVVYLDSYTVDSGYTPVKYYTENRKFFTMIPGFQTEINYFV